MAGLKGRFSPRRHARRLTQVVTAIAQNGWLPGFFAGRVFNGPSKAFCVPGLNCYACPGALGSCPIGAIQAIVGHARYTIPYYLVGFLLLIGGVFGRFVCGFLCPFGLVQELLHKIPSPVRIGTFPGDKTLRYLKYGILAVFVIALPALVVNAGGGGTPWFCTWLCPVGALEGALPLVLTNGQVQGAVGELFVFKMGLLGAVVLLSIVMYRPFCRYLCPLGAVYALFNKVAVFRYHIRENACTHCGTCVAACPMALTPAEEPNHPECVRCGSCKAACPEKAIEIVPRIAPHVPAPGCAERSDSRRCDQRNAR